MDSISIRLLVGPDNFYPMANPIRREVYSAAVSAGFHPLFDHFFSIYFKFYLFVERITCKVFFTSWSRLIILTFLVWHVLCLFMYYCEKKIALLSANRIKPLIFGCCIDIMLAKGKFFVVYDFYLNQLDCYREML